MNLELFREKLGYKVKRIKKWLLAEKIEVSTDKDFRYLIYKPRPASEDARKEEIHQKECMSWLREKYPEFTGMAFHVANEVGTKASVGLIEKREAMGVMSGVSDIIVLRAGKNHSVGIFELKRANGGTLSRAQKGFLYNMSHCGHFVAVCYGSTAFKQAFKDYVEGTY